MFMANLTSEEAGASYDSNIASEVQDREYVSDCEDKYHEVHEMQSDVQHNSVVDFDADYTSDSNIIPYDQYVEDNEEHVVQSNVSYVRNDALMSILDEMHEQGVQRVQTTLFKEVKVMEEILDQMNDEVDKNTVDKQYLEAEMSKVHNELKHISKLEREYLNLQLKYQHLQESFDNNKSQTSQEAPDFNSFFKIKNLEHQIQEKDNITRDSTNEKTSSLLTQIEDLKAQLEGNLKVATRSSVKKKFLLLSVETVREPRVWKATGILFANVGYQWRPTGKKFALGELCPLTKLSGKCGTDHPLVSGLRLFKTYDGESFNQGNFVEKVFIHGHVISKVYYVEGLRHNLFSVGQFCDSDLKVAFKKHSCIVRNMDLCGPIRGHSINGKKYSLVIVDDYSRFTWVKFLSAKHETPEFVINFLKARQSVPRILNKTVYQMKKIVYTCWIPAARNIADILKRTGYFLWAEDALATAWEQPRRYLFGALCYLTNDSEDLGKLQAKADNGIFIGYAPSRKGFRIYNKRTRGIMETIHVTFDELHQTMAPVRINKDLEILFHPMFVEYFEQSTDSEPVPTATVVNTPIVSKNTFVSTTIAQDAPSTSHSLSSSQVHPLVFPQGVAAGPTIEDTSITQADLYPSVNIVAGKPSSAQSTSGDVSLTEPNQVTQPPDHLRKWTKDHPLDNIIYNPSRPVSTRKQLASDALWLWEHIPTVGLMVVENKRCGDVD
ncbi:retrovirus-related pol polyprotein from transposon TNT 1-94 [Tanacetum coccineum]